MDYRSLTCVRRNIISSKDISEWKHLKGIEIPEVPNKKISLLIGSDSPEALCPLEVRSGRKDEPYALRTLLGWSLTGPLKGTRRHQANMNLIHMDQAIGCEESETVLTPIQTQLERLYNAEFTENTAEFRECLSIDDRRAEAIMNDTVRFVNGHYRIGLPWKYDRPQLPNNRVMAERRLQLLKKRLEKNPSLLNQYKQTMEQYISQGHAAEVEQSNEEKVQRSTPTWYLPHHPVVHPQKPGKVRIVYDCAASFDGTSLNEQLLQGPDNTNSLMGVLLRFRKEPIAMISDIEQMFHQVHVLPRDTDALRFLWWPEGDISKEPKDYKMQVHLFGATSSPSVCSYALRKAAEDCKDEFSARTIESVYNSFYVDDCVKSVAKEDEAITLVEELTSLLAKRGFRLTKWISNNRNVLERVPASERAKSVSLDLEELPVERALGVKWNVEEDTLGFRQGKETQCTRRGILSSVASIYDPLGLAAPFVLPAKILLQQLCRIKYEWDATLPPEYGKLWTEIKKTMNSLVEVNIPRCYKPSHFKEVCTVELHHFADASVEGYGVASYLRMVDVEHNVHCTLVMGKSRVAPLKTITIPRLELTAAVLAVKVDRQLKQELQLPIQRVTYWTDSAIVIQYIRNVSKRFQTFEANRLQVIHDGSSSHQWRHVPTEHNPADLASRGIKGSLSTTVTQKDLKRWFDGPDFLWKEENDWPCLPEGILASEDEESDADGSTAQVCAQTNVTDKPQRLLSEVLHRYSCFHRLCKTIAWLLRYRMYLRVRYGRMKQTEVSSGPLTVAEIADAETAVVKLVQEEAFGKKGTQKGSCEVKYDGGRLQSLSPYEEGGILRVGGRLVNAPVEEMSKHQAILPSTHHVTTLIVRYIHRRNGHVGATQTLALMRQKYWIIKGPSTVKRILHKCITCRRQNPQAPTQIMAPLPTARVTPYLPSFSSVGIDYFGPLNVKYRRGTAKRYGCLFTCLASRAAHIEVSSDLSTDSFLQAVSRFASRRGAPKEIYSDNGSNFRGAETELKEALSNWNQDKIRGELREGGIAWHFNAPAASHTGGVWERMIRTTRRILRSLVGSKLLDDETLITMLCEVEKIINDRPLTPLTNDPKDLEVLTPNTLLLLRRNSSIAPCETTKSVKLTERWRLSQQLADTFWERWVSEYLPTLQEKQRWFHRHRNMSVGDLVLIRDENTQRGNWPLGVITETYPDKAGIVRRVQVKTTKGSYERNIRKLCVLECSGD